MNATSTAAESASPAQTPRDDDRVEPDPEIFAAALHRRETAPEVRLLPPAYEMVVTEFEQSAVTAEDVAALPPPPPYAADRQPSPSP
jgi:hypothetical protein